MDSVHWADQPFLVRFWRAYRIWRCMGASWTNAAWFGWVTARTAPSAYLSLRLSVARSYAAVNAVSVKSAE